MDFAQKVVVVTGAARGIGRDYAVALAGRGARVVATDIADSSATLEAIRAAGAEGIALLADVADAAATARLAEEAVAAFGRVDGLVNNAALYGALKGGRFDAIPEADWDATMAVNVKGIWN